jgi:hypothetical protein
MEKEFYYLDEKEQKGPFSLENLKSKGLKPETLVWSEDLDQWKPLKDVEELKILIKKTPPPPPIIDSTPNSSLINEKEDKVVVVDSNVKGWASFKIFFFSFLLVGLSVLISILISSNKKKNLKNEIQSRIQSILEDKTVVLDGTYFLTEGELENTDYKSLLGNDQSELSFFQKWWQREKLYTIFKASNGGFTIRQLTQRYPDGYDIETITSGDMGYKKPLSIYIPAQYVGDFKLSDGYYSNDYRLPVRDCYSEAYSYFTKEDKKSPGSYSPGKFIDISNFPDLRNQYFYMNNREPKQFTSTGLYSSNWYSSDEHGANINTEDWAVYYSTSGKHYVLTENTEQINKDFIKYLGISIGPVILSLILLAISKPKYFRNLKLFGKRWKNSSYENQILFFDHSFVGNLTFTEIINDKIKKGIVKITDSGNTINLSYPNMELFYKIDELDDNNLKLISMKDNSEISFKRLGSEVHDDENLNEIK